MSKKKFFDELWNRMAQHGDFPTLQFSVDNLVGTLNSNGNTGELATAVLSDFSLSQKVIRLANSAMYVSFGGEVSTVSRAIMVLGVDAVGHLALGLQLLDNFEGAARKYPHAAQELHRALLAGEVTRSLSASQGITQGEEAVVCTLLHHLSRLLLVFYFADEWAQIQTLSNGVPARESEACRMVLGVTLEEIAQAAAIKWRLPEVISQTMTHSSLEPDDVSRSHVAWLGAMAEVSSQAAELLSKGADAAEVNALLMAHAEALGLKAHAVDTACEQSDALRQKLLSGIENPAAQERRAESGKPRDAMARLQKGLEEIRSSANDCPVSELAPLVLESAMRALNLENCFMMVLNPASKAFHARIGFGPALANKLGALTFEEGFVPDIFHFAATAGRPLMFEDTFDKETAHRVPKWYRTEMPSSRSVLLVPIYIHSRCIALIYGDWGTTPLSEGLSPSELNLANQLGLEVAKGFTRSASKSSSPT